jgi:hypothetical protein
MIVKNIGFTFWDAMSSYAFCVCSFLGSLFMGAWKTSCSLFFVCSNAVEVARTNAVKSVQWGNSGSVGARVGSVSGMANVFVLVLETVRFLAA